MMRGLCAFEYLKSITAGDQATLCRPSRRGYRVMLVRDRPFPISLPEANGCAPPRIELSTACPGCANVVEAGGEGHVIARSDAEIAIS